MPKALSYTVVNVINFKYLLSFMKAGWFILCTGYQSYNSLYSGIQTKPQGVSRLWMAVLTG